MKNSIFSIFMIFLILFSYADLAFSDSPTGDINIINALNPSGRRGQAATVGFTLVNNATESRTVNFVSTILDGPGTATIAAPTINQVTIGANSQQAVTFNVNIPATATFGDYTATITANQANNNSNSATLAYTVSVTAGSGIQILDLQSRDLSALPVRTLQRDELNDQHSFKIKNNEITALTVSFSVPTAQYTDNDGDIVDIRFTPVNPVVQPNGEVTVQVTFDVPPDQQLKRYSGVVTASTQGNQFSDTLDISFDVVEDVCSDGIVGDALKIDIEDPDNNDEFKPGDKVDIRATVDNDGDNDLDVGVEAFLFNENGDEIDSEDGGTENIDESDDFEFEFSITIPNDPDEVDDGDRLTLYVKAFDDDNEDEQCIVDSVNVDIQLEDDDVEIESATITPSTAICGETVSAVTKVINIGNDDQDDVFVTIKNAALSIREVTERFTLKEFADDQDAKSTKRLSFIVPPNTKEGSYPIDFEVTFGSGETASDTVFLNVGQCSGTTPEEEEVPEEQPEEDEEVTDTPETGKDEEDQVTGGSTTFLPTSSLFGGRGATTAFWIIADIALVILAIYFLILIFRRRN